MLLLCGCLGTLLGLYLTRQTMPRHFGHYFVTLIAAYWLADPGRREGTPDFPSLAPPFGHVVNRHRAGFLTMILLAQATGGIAAFAAERRTPYSASLETARYIRFHYPNDVVVATTTDSGGPALSGYLGRPIYYTSRQEYGTYLIWDAKRLRGRTPIHDLALMARHSKHDILLLTEPGQLATLLPDQSGTPSQIELKPVRSFENSITKVDRYDLTIIHYVHGN